MAQRGSGRRSKVGTASFKLGFQLSKKWHTNSDVQLRKTDEMKFPSIRYAISYSLPNLACISSSSRGERGSLKCNGMCFFAAHDERSDRRQRISTQREKLQN
jgi:hypothetical protein